MFLPPALLLFVSLLCLTVFTCASDWTKLKMTNPDGAMFVKVPKSCVVFTGMLSDRSQDIIGLINDREDPALFGNIDEIISNMTSEIECHTKETLQSVYRDIYVEYEYLMLHLVAITDWKEQLHESSRADTLHFELTILGRFLDNDDPEVWPVAWKYLSWNSHQRDVNICIYEYHQIYEWEQAIINVRGESYVYFPLVEE